MKMNCLLVSDYNWDNMPIVMKRMVKIPQDTRMNIFYGNKTEEFSKIIFSHELNLMRRNIKNFSEFASTIDFCIIFTNLIEYNNHSKYIMDFCEENNVPYLVFTENNSDYFLNMERSDNKISKVIKTFVKRRGKRITKPFANTDACSKITNLETARFNLKNKYSTLKASRRTIVVL